MTENFVKFFRPYFVYFGCFTANMLSFAAGASFNWSATMEPNLESNDTSINPLPQPASTLESSWIVAIVMCGAVVGPSIGGVSLAKFGKKKTIIILGVPLFIGHLIIVFARQWWMFLIARFMMGLSLGSSFGVMTSYTGDIAEDNNRGLLGSFTTVFMSFGGLFVYVIGPYTSIKLFSLLNLIPGILLFTLFGLFVPETPYDLLQKNSIDEARKSLSWFRGKDPTEIDVEFKKLQDSVNTREKKVQATVVLKTILESRPLLQGVKIVGTTIMCQGLSGMSAVASYYQTIFEVSSGSLKPTYSVMIIGVVTLFSTLLSSQLVERVGRKFLLLIGFSFMGVSLFSLGTYFYLKSEEHNTNPISWLPLASLIIHTMAYNIQGNIPWVLLTDIFPPYILGLCSTMGASTMFIFSFTTTLGFPYLNQAFGNYGSFYTFGCLMVCAVIFALTAVPETKGKSIEEVHDILSKK